MITKELKMEIKNLLNRNIGIMMYAVVKTEEGKVVKFVNIADEINQEDNTSQGLLEGFSEIINARFEGYDEESDVMKLSSADERKNALYFYDLDIFPEEMQLMKKVYEKKEEIGVFNFREYELSQIIAFIVVIGTENNKILLYKQQYPVSLLNRDKYMLTPIPHQNRLIKFEKDILRIDFNFQFFLWNGVVYISDIEKMEKICSFHDIIINEAKNSIKKIEEMQILDNVEVLADELDNIAFARKLTRIYKDSKVLGHVENQSIINFTQRHRYFVKNPLKLNDTKDKFMLDTKKSKNTFIKLMNDDFLTSELTYSDYESLAKNNA